MQSAPRDFEHPGPGGQQPGGEAEIKKKLLCARHRVTVISRATTIYQVGS